MLTYTTKFRLLDWTKKVWNLLVHAQPKWHHSTCFVFLLSSLHFRTLFVVKISDGKQGSAEIFLWNWSRHCDVFNQISFFKITDFLFTWRFFNMGFSMIESHVVDITKIFLRSKILFVSIQRCMQINDVEFKITQQPHIVLLNHHHLKSQVF